MIESIQNIIIIISKLIFPTIRPKTKFTVPRTMDKKKKKVAI